MNETPPRASRSGYRAPALEKGLDVLELVAELSQPTSLTAMAERLGRTKQEIFRVVLCLEDRRYLIRDRAGRYRMSTKLFELGSKHASTQALVVRAMPHMERLADRLGESCHLNIVVQDRMLVVARADCDADIALAVRVGASFALHQRNTGRVALAHLPDERRREYWGRSGEPGERIERWERELSAIRSRGLEVADSPITVGVRDCAAPLFGGGGRLMGVLCVSHMVRVDEPSDRPDIPRAVVSCANAISGEFGPGVDTEGEGTAPGGPDPS